jgi:hypothetical protein
VVWQGSAGDRRPYADQLLMSAAAAARETEFDCRYLKLGPCCIGLRWRRRQVKKAVNKKQADEKISHRPADATGHTKIFSLYSAFTRKSACRAIV